MSSGLLTIRCRRSSLPLALSGAILPHPPIAGRLHVDLPALSNDGSPCTTARRLLCELTRRHSGRPRNRPGRRTLPPPNPVQAEPAARPILPLPLIGQGPDPGRRPLPRDRMGRVCPTCHDTAPSRRQGSGPPLSPPPVPPPSPRPAPFSPPPLSRYQSRPPSVLGHPGAVSAYRPPFTRLSPAFRLSPRSTVAYGGYRHGG